MLESEIRGTPPRVPQNGSPTLRSGEQLQVDVSIDKHCHYIRGYFHAVYDETGNPVIWIPYHKTPRLGADENAIELISKAMLTLPFNTRVQIAKNHVEYCSHYDFPDDDVSLAIIHIWIGKNTTSISCINEMVPVLPAIAAGIIGVRV